MAYVIHRKEPLDGEVRRILIEQNRRALALLERWQQNPREQVHSARQTFKRLRALLRLVRAGARYVYEVENRFYRDLARSLAYVRDTEAVIEALDVLDRDAQAQHTRESLQMLRTGLQQRAAREMASPALDVEGRIRAAREALGDADARLRRTPFPDLSRKAMRSAVRKTMRRCERGFGQVLITGAAADFHAWRRDVKCAYHQSRLMQELMPEWAAACGPPLAKLGELLGHSQDLTVLDAVLDEQPHGLDLDGRLAHLREVIDDRRRAVQEEARQLGVRIFLQPSTEAGTEGAPDPAVSTEAADAPSAPSPTAVDADAVEASPAEVARTPDQPPPANVVDLSTRRARGEETN